VSGDSRLRPLVARNILFKRADVSVSIDIEDLGAAMLTTRTVSPLSLLKNPMILIAGASMIIVFGMPYLMDNSTFSPFLPHIH